MNNLFVRRTAVMILWAAWVIAMQQLLYAGHLPGDSFTAAVILLIALMLQYVVLGRRAAARKLPVRFFLGALQTGLGLLLLLFAGPLLLGKAPLATVKMDVAGYTLSSTLLFEAGIFLIVVGVVAYALVTFKEPDR